MMRKVLFALALGLSVSVMGQELDEVYAVPTFEANEDAVTENQYSNYPEPEIPTYVTAPQKINLTRDDGTEYDLDGTILRMLVRGENTVVLTNSADGTPHVYLIDNVNKVIVKELSINGIAESEPDNAGFYSRLADICFTADNQLVGMNSVMTQYSVAYVDKGFTRGTLRLFKWADFDSDPVEWITTQNSANFYHFRFRRLVIDGPADDCLVTLVGVNTAPSSGMRFVKLTVADNQITSEIYTEKTTSAESNFTLPKVGEPILTLSPRSDDNVVLDGDKTLPIEVATAKSNGTNSEVVGRFESDEEDAAAVGISFFKYAQHQFMVTPYITSNGEEGVKVGGIKLYDVTAGLDQAALVTTTNTDLEPLACDFMSTGAAVKGEAISLYLMQDNKITKWTYLDNEQLGTSGIFAYGLELESDENTCTFSFNANSDAQKAYITFYDAEGKEVGTIDVPDVKEGENSIKVEYSDLPESSGETLTWAVTLEGEPITTIRRINPIGQYYSGQLFVAVDKSPSSPKMGTIYAGNRVGSKHASNGVYLYNANGIRVSDQLYNGNHAWNSNYRMAVDCQGKLYIPDWSESSSGVFVADPEDLGGTWTEFFIGERDQDGLIVNNGVKVGSSVPGVAIGGKGADTKLYVYLEDFGNGVGVYNIGQPDGTIVDTWDTAPNQYFDIGAWQLNTNGNVVADPQGHGVWVSQYRSAGNNAAGVPSLMFVDNDGNVTFNSGRYPYNEMLNGSDRAGFAVNEASDMLVINDGSTTLQFYDITWEGNTPDISPKYSYKTNHGSIYQMGFDYGGNLVCAGGNIGIYSLPTEENTHTTPACGESKVIHLPTTAVTITLAADGTSYSGKRALDFSGLDITAYKATQKNPQNIHCESVTIVPANTGIIIMGAPGEYLVPTTTEGTTDDFSDNLLVANVDETYTVTAADEGFVYRFVNKEGKAVFQKATAGQTVSVGKAYLRLKEASALEFIGFEEGTTDISPAPHPSSLNSGWYTLDGRKIEGQPKQKGIYIVNGKKVVKR